MPPPRRVVGNDEPQKQTPTQPEPKVKGPANDSLAKLLPVLKTSGVPRAARSHETAFLSAAADESQDWFLYRPVENYSFAIAASFLIAFATGAFGIRYWRKAWDVPWVEEKGWKVKGPFVAVTLVFLGWFFWTFAVHLYTFWMLYPFMMWDGRILVHVLMCFNLFVAMILGTSVAVRESKVKRSKMLLDGNARWSTNKEVAELTKSAKKGGVWLGDVKGKPVVSPYHTLTVAPTRSGKGTDVIVPNLLMYKGSVIVNDVKGENWFVTSAQRRKMGRVWLLDPMHHVRDWEPGTKVASTNWVARINPYASDAVMRAGTIADAICIPPEGGGGENAFFVQAGWAIVRALILWAAQLKPPHNNLLTVRKILTQSEKQMGATMELIGKKGVEAAARGATAFWGNADKVRSSIKQEANNHLDFLDDPRMAEALTKNSIPWDRMKAETHSVYVVIPPSQISMAKRFIRLVFGQALDEQMRTKGSPKYNILYVLDEFPQLGYFKQIEDSLTVVAGYGIILWPIVQDLGQLEHLYKTKYRSFLANTMQQYFKATDWKTVEDINKMLGKYSVVFKQTSASGRQGLFADGGDGNISLQHRARDLMTTDEIQTTPKAIIKPVGHYPILADRTPYYKDDRFKEVAGPNPFLDEAEMQLPPIQYEDDNMETPKEPPKQKKKAEGHGGEQQDGAT